MKRVLIVLGRLSVGGAEKIGRDIGFHADKAKYEIHYLVFGDDIGSYEKELVECGCMIHHMNPPAENHFLFLKNLKKLLEEEQIDIIHSHTMFNSGWTMLIGKWCGVPIRITHSHSIKGTERRGLLKNVYERIMRKLILGCSTKLIACGKSAGRWLYGAVFDKKGILIYNGINLQEFLFSYEKRNEIREQYGIKEKFVIGHAGHLAAVKNQLFLINILPEIILKRPDAILLLLGDGSDREMLEKRVKELKIEDQVHSAEPSGLRCVSERTLCGT